MKTFEAEVIRRLRAALPREAFDPAPRKMWAVLGHLVVIAASYAALRSIDRTLGRLLVSAIIGHGLTCVVFLAHELSHGTILRKSRLRYVAELGLWGLNLIPVTMWVRLHNQTHHAHANAPGDPDRFYTTDELNSSALRRWYTRLFFPHGRTVRWNPLVGFHFLTYVGRHLIAVLYPGRSRPAVVTAKPAYTAWHRLWIAFETACIVAMQYAVYLAVGGHLELYVWASPVALLFTSTFAMSYIWTNHYLRPMSTARDSLATSTSIRVHRVFDRLHCNFSYHTEHHLFPNANSDYYPAMSALLRELYPSRYHRLDFRAAWRLLWAGEPSIQVAPAAGTVADAPFREPPERTGAP